MLKYFLVLFIVSFLALTQTAWAVGGFHESLMNSERINEYIETRSTSTAEAEQLKACLQAVPQAQLLMKIRQFLPEILSVYSQKQDSAQDRELAKKYIDLIKNKFSKVDSYKVNPQAANVYYLSSPDNRFQVGSIIPDRLAFNNGTDIYFNAQALAKMNNLTISDSVLLWLHEILHFDQETPLEVRDKFAAKVAQFVKPYAVETSSGSSSRLLALVLPNALFTNQEKIDFVHDGRGYPTKLPAEEYLQNKLKEKVLILEHTSSDTHFYEEAYKSFVKTLDPAHMYPNVASGVVALWPEITLEGARVSSQKSLQINYFIRNARYMYDYNGILTRDPGSYEINPSMWAQRHRLDLQIQSHSIDSQRLYSEQLKDGFFEINRIEDKNGRRYLSLRAKGEKIFAALQKAPSLHLIGKDSKSQQLLSLEIKKFKAVSENEALLHLEIPLRNIEPHQILLPVISDNGTYSEVIIRPMRPETILGSVIEALPSGKVVGFTLLPKELDKDKFMAELSLQTNKKVVGITLDMTHHLLGQSISLNNLPLPQERTHHEVSLYDSRKYYVKEVETKTSNSAIQFVIPEEKIEQLRSNPQARAFGRRSRFGAVPNFLENPGQKYRTIADLNTRSIERAWVHYSDGSIEPIDSKYLPKGFSLQSKESEEREWFEQQKHFARLSGKSPPIMCKSVFSP